MEENSKNSGTTRLASDVGLAEGSWVSPDVAAAMAGEQVEMGKDLSENDPNTTTDA